MDQLLQIALVVLVVVGVWALVELALVIRRSRSVVDELDKTMAEVNDTLAETRPVVAKLDGALDELSPAIAQVEPLLKSANIAVDALSANLVEIEGVVRDVSSVTGAAASASNAVTSISDSATGAVQKLLNKHKGSPAGENRALSEGAPAPEADEVPTEPESAPAPKQYYTYGEAAPADTASAQEESDE